MIIPDDEILTELAAAPVPPDAVDDPVSFVDGQRETKDAMITRLMRELAAEAKERRRQESLASMWKKNADRAMWDNRRSPVPPSTPPVGREELERRGFVKVASVEAALTRRVRLDADGQAAMGGDLSDAAREQKR